MRSPLTSIAASRARSLRRQADFCDRRPVLAALLWLVSSVLSVLRIRETYRRRKRDRGSLDAMRTEGLEWARNSGMAAGLREALYPRADEARREESLRRRLTALETGQTEYVHPGWTSLEEQLATGDPTGLRRPSTGRFSG